MITSENIKIDKIASHYDELDNFYREIWGNHVHHGFWKNGNESIAEATTALVDFMAEKLNIASNDKICDVGCGYGETSRYLVQKYNCQVTSYTISKNQYDYALLQGPENHNPHFILNDWLTNNLDDNSMDIVFSIESSEHMPDFDKFFSEAARVLRPGGKLAIFAWLQSSMPTSWMKKYLLQPLCDEGRMRLASAHEYQNHIIKNNMQMLSFDLISDQVSRTWTLCIQRGMTKILTDKRYRNYLLSSGSQNREFLKTLFRIRAAFATSAMEYGLFIAKKI